MRRERAKGARKALFGGVTDDDRLRNRQRMSAFLKASADQAAMKYNFDFENERPISGKYEWQLMMTPPTAYSISHKSRTVLDFVLPSVNDRLCTPPSSPEYCSHMDYCEISPVTTRDTGTSTTSPADSNTSSSPKNDSGVFSSGDEAAPTSPTPATATATAAVVLRSASPRSSPRLSLKRKRTIPGMYCTSTSS